VLGAVSLGAVGAVLAAGAALSAPNPSPRSDQQPVVVTTTSPLPCPAGTEDRGDSCVKVVVAPADPLPAVNHPAPAAPVGGDVSTRQRSADRSPEAEPSESPEPADHEDAQDTEDSQDSPDAPDSSESPDSPDGGGSGD
jgi:hypothetical protein